MPILTRHDDEGVLDRVLGKGILFETVKTIAVRVIERPKRDARVVVTSLEIHLGHADPTRG